MHELSKALIDDVVK
ncbi:MULTISPECIES: hypothetical protein [Pseudomonas]|nr:MULTISPECIES: hypothetical protein [Pseudomonas]